MNLKSWSFYDVFGWGCLFLAVIVSIGGGDPSMFIFISLTCAGFDKLDAIKSAIDKINLDQSTQ